MYEVRRGTDRGEGDHGWLKSFHSFSFADYFDPARLGFGPLRVINEDRVAPGAGFGAHGHRDMEIISYVLSGALAHRDSIGNGSALGPGDVQRMSAGRGIRHSEFNGSQLEPVHFLQIWIVPSEPGIEPSYEEKHFTEADKRGRLCLLASPDRAQGSMLIHQDVRLYAGLYDGAETSTQALPQARQAYVHLARGTLTVNGVELQGGDAMAITAAESLSLRDGKNAEVLVFDLPEEPANPH